MSDDEDNDRTRAAREARLTRRLALFRPQSLERPHVVLHRLAANRGLEGRVLRGRFELVHTDGVGQPACPDCRQPTFFRSCDNNLLVSALRLSWS